MSSKVGDGDIQYDQVPTFLADTDTEQGLSFAGYLGYIFDNQLIIDDGQGTVTSDVVFGALDNIYFDTTELLLGFDWQF